VAVKIALHGTRRAVVGRRHGRADIQQSRYRGRGTLGGSFVGGV